MKWGGELTPAGRSQSERLGERLRRQVYVPYTVQDDYGAGLLRLHSTYRHDFKIFASDEGRVMMSAAAFTKGLLALEGSLTPILVSLVHRDEAMLDNAGPAQSLLEEAKTTVKALMNAGVLHRLAFICLAQIKSKDHGQLDMQMVSTPWTTLRCVAVK